MEEFDPQRLSELRIARGLTAVEVARLLRVSAAQVHRLEHGDRRLTVNTLIAYCRALGVSPVDLLATPSVVAVTGVIESDFQIRDLPADEPSEVPAPALGAGMTDVAAVRWAATGRFQPMRDHVVYFQDAKGSVPEEAWDKRCVLTRANGSRCLGWPVRHDDQVHIDFGTGPGEFNVDLVSASPVIAVMPPFAVAQLGA